MPKTIPLSALQHFLFCPRQCALIHNKQVWAENRFANEGQFYTQALCLKEMFVTAICQGLIFYGKTRRRRRRKIIPYGLSALFRHRKNHSITGGDISDKRDAYGSILPG